MIGYGTLLECLDDPDIEKVLTVGRRKVDIEHAKLEQHEHDDFTDFSSIADVLTGYDACLWCLGISSSGMSEEKYRRITVDFTLAAAEVLKAQNPSMVVCFISGAGTNRDSRQMWARVKAEAEDKLAEVGFEAVYNFRPAGIIPERGARSGVASYRAVYALTAPFHGLLKGWKTYVTSTPQLGRAMIRAARGEAKKTTLENIDICALGA